MKIKALMMLGILLTSSLVVAGEAEVKKAAQAFVGERDSVVSVRKTNVSGLYEVQLESNQLFYMDDSGQYAVLGDLVDTKARRNLTEERRNKLAQINFSELPLNLAIKQVRGNGKRVFATFEDPNCSYCKKLARELQSMTDITMYTFVLPVLGPDSIDKSRNILCAAEPAKVWNDWMINNTVPPVARCDNSLEKIQKLAQRLGVNGTPALFLSDGSRIPGFVPVAELEKKLGK